VIERRDLGVVVRTERGDQLPVAGAAEFSEGSAGLLVVRPETVTLFEYAEARGPSLAGVVALRVFEGARYVYEIDVGAAAPVRVEEPSTGEARVFRIGERVRVGVSSETVALVRDERYPRT